MIQATPELGANRVIPPRITSIVRSGSNVVIQWAYGNPPLQVQFKDSLNNPVRSSSGAPRRAAPLPCPFNLARDSFAWLASRELLAHDEKSERKENAKIRFASYLDDEFAAIFDIVLAGL